MKATVAALLFLECGMHLSGHAILLSSAPGPQEIVSGPAVHVQLRFNSRIDVKRSRLMLLLPGEHERVLIEGQPSPDVLTSDPMDLAPGQYILRWQVLAEDGHITRGEFAFRVR